MSDTLDLKREADRRVVYRAANCEAHGCGLSITLSQSPTLTHSVRMPGLQQSEQIPRMMLNVWPVSGDETAEAIVAWLTNAHVLVPAG